MDITIYTYTTHTIYTLIYYILLLFGIFVQVKQNTYIVKLYKRKAIIKDIWITELRTHQRFHAFEQMETPKQ